MFLELDDHIKGNVFSAEEAQSLNSLRNSHEKEMNRAAHALIYMLLEDGSVSKARNWVLRDTAYQSDEDRDRARVEKYARKILLETLDMEKAVPLSIRWLRYNGLKGALVAFAVYAFLSALNYQLFKLPAKIKACVRDGYTEEECEMFYDPK